MTELGPSLGARSTEPVPEHKGPAGPGAQGAPRGALKPASARGQSFAKIIMKMAASEADADTPPASGKPNAPADSLQNTSPTSRTKALSPVPETSSCGAERAGMPSGANPNPHPGALGLPDTPGDTSPTMAHLSSHLRAAKSSEIAKATADERSAPNPEGHEALASPARAAPLEHETREQTGADVARFKLPHAEPLASAQGGLFGPGATVLISNTSSSVFVSEIAARVTALAPVGFGGPSDLGRANAAATVLRNRDEPLRADYGTNPATHETRGTNAGSFALEAEKSAGGLVAASRRPHAPASSPFDPSGASDAKARQDPAWLDSALRAGPEWLTSEPREQHKSVSTPTAFAEPEAGGAKTAADAADHGFAERAGFQSLPSQGGAGVALVRGAAQSLIEPNSTPSAVPNPAISQDHLQTIAAGLSVVLSQIDAVPQSAAKRGIEVVLHPEELGRIRIAFDPEASQPVLSLSVENAETLTLMRRHLDVLQTALHDAGFPGSELDLSAGLENDQQRERLQASASDAFIMTENAERAGAEASPVAHDKRSIGQRSDNSRGRLDLRL